MEIWIYNEDGTRVFLQMEVYGNVQVKAISKEINLKIYSGNESSRLVVKG